MVVGRQIEDCYEFQLYATFFIGSGIVAFLISFIGGFVEWDKKGGRR